MEKLPLSPLCGGQRGGSQSLGSSVRWRRTPPLSLCDISPARGGEWIRGCLALDGGGAGFGQDGIEWIDGVVGEEDHVVGTGILQAGLVAEVFGPVEQEHPLSAVETSDPTSSHVDPERGRDLTSDVAMQGL